MGRLLCIALILHGSWGFSQEESCRIDREAEGTYSAIKQEAYQLRLTWQRKYQKASESDKGAILDSAGVAFKELLCEQLLPHWYGTSWTFEGHTSVPNQGEVACGYLVSTTLLHMGISVNRYKLAQQAPKGEAKTINCGEEPVELGADTSWHYFNHLDEGLYFVGLDNHVGFLNVLADHIEFIHSNYSGDVCVMAEYALCSGPFNWSQNFYVAPISGNREFTRRWLERRAFEVYK